MLFLFVLLFHANTDSSILNQGYATISKTHLFGNSKYSNEVSLQILKQVSTLF